MSIVLIDVDHVTVQTHVEWYRRYNLDYNDDLTPDRVIEWNIHKFVKPECGTKIYDYLKDPDLYDNVPLTDGVLEGVSALKVLGHRCVFLTSGIHRGKLDLLLRHGLIKSEFDLIIANDKSLIKGDYLIDDGMHNITAWNATGGIGILFSAKHNEQYDYHPRVDNWTQAVQLIKIFESLRMFIGVTEVRWE